MQRTIRTLAHLVRRLDRWVLLRSPTVWLLQIHHVVAATLLFHLLMGVAVQAYDRDGRWILSMPQVFHVLGAGSLVALVLWARVAIRRSTHATSARPEGLRLFVGALLCASLVGTIPGLTVARLQAQLASVDLARFPGWTREVVENGAWLEQHPGDRLVALFVIVGFAEWVALARTVQRATLLRVLAGVLAVWFTVAFVDLVLVTIAQPVAVSILLGLHAAAVLLLIAGWTHRRMWGVGVHGGLVAVFMAPFVPFLWAWLLTLAEATEASEFPVPRGLLAALAAVLEQAHRFPHAEAQAWLAAVGLTLASVALLAGLAWRASSLPSRAA